MLATLLLSTLTNLSAVTVEYRPLPPAAVATAPALVAAETALGCDDGSTGGTLVQRQDHYFGNRFTAPCTATRVVSASFVHSGPALDGAYAFRLHLLDGACRELGVTAELTTPAAADAPLVANVDLSSYRWCVEGEFALVLEPLACADGTTGHDCFPALVVDATSDAASGAHCAIVDTPTADGRQCLAARSIDGRFFDFRLRVQVTCGAPECTTAVQPGTWSAVKRLYRDPRPGTAD
jgi:hypothetical protein